MSVRKTHIVRGKVVLYTWRGNRHWHALGYILGRYFRVWR